jgi:hypothetical protein
MEKLTENAAGIDIGAQKVFVAVEGREVKSYYTFTEDFEKLCEYLLEYGDAKVAASFPYLY